MMYRRYLYFAIAAFWLILSFFPISLEHLQIIRIVKSILVLSVVFIETSYRKNK